MKLLNIWIESKKSKALIIKKGNNLMISRSNIISQIMEKVTKDHLLVFEATGMISREVFNHKDRNENFYMIGSMGLASSLL